MASAKRAPLPAGRQPWDPANGLRVGALVGALLGAAVTGLVGFLNFWAIAATAAIGGAVGYWSEKRRQRDPPGQNRPPDQ